MKPGWILRVISHPQRLLHGSLTVAITSQAFRPGYDAPTALKGGVLNQQGIWIILDPGIERSLWISTIDY